MFTSHTKKRDEINAASVRTRLTMALVLAGSTMVALFGMNAAAHAQADVASMATMMVAPQLVSATDNAGLVIAMSVALAGMAISAAFLSKSLGRNISEAGRTRI